MKKWISLLLVLLMCLSLCACGGAEETGKNVSNNAAAEDKKTESFAGSSLLTEKVPMYAPGAVVKTDFGEITVLDAAFCGKAQLIDGLPKPAYNSAGDGRFVFAMRTTITNASEADLALMEELKVAIQFSEEDTFGCSKGGNYKSSDPLYKMLPAGTSGEYIICGRIPVDVYQANDQFSVSFNGANLGFAYADIQIYNAMSYQEGENLLTSMENLISLAGTAPEETKAASEEKIAAVPQLAFALEDARYEITNSYLAVEVKIRNNSDVYLEWPSFNGMILDANGDILENCSCSFTNGLEAGQAGWTAIRISEPTTLEEMDSIKLVTVWYKENPEAKTHGLRFDLPEPFVVDIHELEQK